MNKMDPIKFHASNVKNNSNNAFNGAIFESFKQNQINSKTSVTQQKDVFVPNNPPKKEAGLKHLFNALPDSYIDEIIVGGLALAATSYFIFSGRGRNRVLNGLKNGVDNLSRKFDDADSAVKQVETSISTIANDMSAHKNTVETAQKQAKNTLEEEILTLICHGILHLFGFDHLTKKDYDFVVGIQNQVIKKYEQISIKNF